MREKHYLLSDFRYAAKQFDGFQGKTYRSIMEEEYNKRRNSTSCVDVGLSIHPFYQDRQERLDEEYPLFYMILPEYLGLIKKVFYNSKEIESLLGDYRDYARKNAIKLEIKNPDKIKKIYEDIITDEVEKGKEPDGYIFRNGPGGIMDDDKKKYLYLASDNEKEIRQQIDFLIEYMNTEDHSDIIKALVSHFIFEYIHPFYKGNAWMANYILGTYLSSKLDYLSGLATLDSMLSNKDRHMKALLDVVDPPNKAELTVYISEMMEIIILGQEKVKELLKTEKAKELLKEVSDKGFEDLEEYVKSGL